MVTLNSFILSPRKSIVDGVGSVVETSSISQSHQFLYLSLLNDQASEGPEEAESHQAGNTTKVSSVPPCTPTPTSSTDDVPGDTKDSEECEGGVAEEESRSLLMDIVSQIAAENGTDYLQDI